MVRFLRQKSVAMKSLQHMILQAERLQTGRSVNSKVRYVKSDNGGEYISASLEDWFSQNGILHRRTPLYSPESIDSAEPLNTTLLDMDRAMVHNLPQRLLPIHRKLWGIAIITASYTRNRTYSSACSVKRKSPLEVMTGKRPTVAHMRKVWFSRVHTHSEADTVGKLPLRAKRGFIVGYQNVLHY